MPKKPVPVDRSYAQRASACQAQSSPGTNSKRWSQYVDGVYPTHVISGERCFLNDPWGHRYLDFISALGAISLGYSYPRVVEAVQAQIYKGVSHSLPSPLEIELSEQLQSLIPGAEKVRFLKTGSEACSAAIRIARAYTNRKTVYSRGYHGHSDLFTSLTEPASGVADTFRIYPFTDLKQIDENTAAVIVEAIELDLSNEWRDYLISVQKSCQKHGAVFILDEVVTGFRVPMMTAAKMWGLEPDIIVLGKGIANGYPLSATCGRQELMDVADYFISSTFSGECVSLAAAQATLDEMETSKNLEDLLFYGERLRSKLNALDPDIRFDGYGTRAMLNVNHPKTALFMQEMCKAGFLFGKAWFFHFAHLEEQVEDLVISAAKEVVDRIHKRQVKLQGKAPQETFKR